MKNLGSRWTVPDIARTAAARSSFLVAISSERDSGSISSSSSSRSSSRSNSNSNNNSNSTSTSNRRRRSSSIINNNNSVSELRRKTYNKKYIGVRGRISNEIRGKARCKCELVIAGKSAVVEVLQGGAFLSVRSNVTASFNLIHGTRSSDVSTPRNHRPWNQDNCQQHQQLALYFYSPAFSWDEHTRHFRNC